MQEQIEFMKLDPEKIDMGCQKTLEPNEFAFLTTRSKSLELRQVPFDD